MPFQRDRYPANWKDISLAIRERDGWQCKWCGAENGKPNPVTGSKVVLTVAHLGTPHADGTPGDKSDKMDVRPENLAALCQRCHLNFDRDEHARNAAETRRRRKIEAGQMPLPLIGDDMKPNQPGWYLVRWSPNDPWDVVYVGYISERGLSWGFAPNDDPEFITNQTLDENETDWRPATKEQANATQEFFNLCYR